MLALNALEKVYAEVEKAVILLVDDDKLNTAILRRALSDFGQTFEVHSGQGAIDFCKKHPPDLVILDVDMPGLSGLETCRLLRAMDCMLNCPIIFSTAHTSTEIELACWEAGGSDFVPKPVVPLTLIKRIYAHVVLKLKSDVRDSLALFDGLTELRNRRYFDDFYENQLNLAKRNGRDIALLVIDIDMFKLYNDFYGHQQGDECLKQVAQLIAEPLHRPTDVAIRYGGEEFVVVLPDTDLQGAKFVAEKITAQICESAIPHLASPHKKITVSIGAASLKELTASADLFSEADKKLYSAKVNGRNGVAA
jgi:diguanylate cyclase (GGDEF)-like protein